MDTGKSVTGRTAVNNCSTPVVSLVLALPLTEELTDEGSSLACTESVSYTHLTLPTIRSV